MINIILLITMFFNFSSINPVKDEIVCITDKNIMKPLTNWNVLSIKNNTKDKMPSIEVDFHNPYQKQKNSLDAKILLLIDPADPLNAEKYNLIVAVFYNENNTVVFTRNFIKKDNKIKLSQCFTREVASKFGAIKIDDK